MLYERFIISGSRREIFKKLTRQYPRVKPPRGYIYAFGSSADIVKIGKSANIPFRFLTLDGESKTYFKSGINQVIVSGPFLEASQKERDLIDYLRKFNNNALSYSREWFNASLISVLFKFFELKLIENNNKFNSSDYVFDSIDKFQTALYYYIKKEGGIGKSFTLDTFKKFLSKTLLFNNIENKIAWLPNWVITNRRDVFYIHEYTFKLFGKSLIEATHVSDYQI